MANNIISFHFSTGSLNSSVHAIEDSLITFNIELIVEKLNRHWQYMSLLRIQLCNKNISRKSIFHEAGLLGGL